MKMQGIVKWYDNAKGYGFISPMGDSPDLFVNINILLNTQLTTLKAGDKVLYDEHIISKKLCAINIEIITI